MVVRLVAHGDLFLPEFLHPFVVDLYAAGNRRGRSLFPEDVAHVIQETGDRQHDRGWFQIVPAIQEKLGVLITLRG